MILSNEIERNNIELQYHCMRPYDKKWFCRIWVGYNFGQSYGKSKFEAYRLAKNKIK